VKIHRWDEIQLLQLPEGQLLDLIGRKMLDRIFSQQEELQFENWTVKVRRRAFRRKLSIYLKDSQFIYVNANRTLSSKQILMFLHQKRTWIIHGLKNLEIIESQIPKVSFIEGESLPINGGNYCLQFAPTVLRKSFGSLSENQLILHFPIKKYQLGLSQQQVKEALQAYYRTQFERELLLKSPLWQQKIGVQASEFKLRNQKSRWGSCNRRKVISLNYRLWGAPEFVRDYILIHELCHLQHMNHSAHFWKLVETHCPEYQDAESWLNEQGRILDFLI